MTFHNGDVVKLKSDGPNMTVSNTANAGNPYPFVSCLWFFKNQNDEWILEKGDFHPGALERVLDCLGSTIEI